MLLLNKALLKRIFIILSIIGVSIFVYIYLSAFMPIFLALLTAMMFEPLVRLLQKRLKTANRLWPVTIVYIIFILVSGFIINIVVTRIINSLLELGSNVPQYSREIQKGLDSLIHYFNDIIAEIPQGDMIIVELERQSDGLIDTVLQFTTKFVTAFGVWLQSIPNILFVTLVYLITLFLFSLDLPRLKELFFQQFNPEMSRKLQFISQKMGKVFWGYWKAQFILSVGVFIATYISLLFISPDLALLMSSIIWLVDIIPLYVGPALILVPWALIVMLLGSTNTGIALIVLASVLLIIRRILEPKVLGDAIGLAALPTVLSMYFGFVFFGVFGLIMGPFVYIIIRSAKEAGLTEVVANQEVEDKERI
ncbi:Sodium-lithium/proton antiporter [Sutcliffiella rhizosphaerae]|uniref:Sodium-lithium/proton antiporter n=2 Tax=Sutcliffiella rhizosphaerae TaxID=2880967 RepID=A0ABM8YU82_9BACI|nr:Sodium-lithium/proton antiporter [Sutcliffiella rhizosphaerae]